MSIQKPYDLSLRGKTIDGNEVNEVSWKVSGDIQTAYKIDILLNISNSLVWTSNKVTSFALKHNIPHSSLLNGKEYKILITVWSQTSANQASDPEIFQTSSRPVVTVPSMGTVNSFSFNFSASYAQAEIVPLRNYNVNLYDDKKNLIDKSNVKTILPMEHLFSNLQTEHKYFIEFIATSSKGLTGTSGLVLFDVFYYRPKMNVNLQGKNIPNAGIELSWFVRQIIGNTDGSEFIGDEKIDTSDGSEVWFDEGFSIDRDFTLKLWLENVPSKKDLIVLRGENGTITLQYDAVLERYILTREFQQVIREKWTSNIVSGYAYLVYFQQINRAINIQAETI